MIHVVPLIAMQHVGSKQMTDDIVGISVLCQICTWTTYVILTIFIWCILCWCCEAFI